MERKEYAPLSFWAWNEDMDDGSICRRIEEFYEQGLRGFFMHSRAGLMTPYLSDEWFRACRTAAKRQKNWVWKPGYMMKTDGPADLQAAW